MAILRALASRPQPAGQRLVLERRELVQVAALAQRLKGLEADVDLVADQQQTGRGVGILGVRGQRLQSPAFTSSIPLPTTSRRLAIIGSVRRRGQHRADAALLQLEAVGVERGGGAGLGQHGRAHRGDRGVDQEPLARQAVDGIDLPARHRGGDVRVLRRRGHTSLYYNARPTDSWTIDSRPRCCCSRRTPS